MKIKIVHSLRVELDEAELDVVMDGLDQIASHGGSGVYSHTAGRMNAELREASQRIRDLLSNDPLGRVD